MKMKMRVSTQRAIKSSPQAILNPIWNREVNLSSCVGAVTVEQKRRYAVCLCGLLMSVMLAACGGGSIDAPTNVTTVVPDATVVTGNTTLVNGLAINNFTNNETISYPLPILYGLTNPELTSVQVALNGQNYQAEVVSGVFKLPILLRGGINEMTITTGSTSNRFTLNYQASTNPKKVKMMVAIPADEDGRFLAEPGVDNSLETAKQKLKVEAWLMQSATAEMMYKAGKSHMTYNLMMDADGTPLIETLRLPLSKAELLKKTGNELYDLIAATIRANAYDANVKYMVTMSFSSYSDGQVTGHTALGGGYLGVFGALHLHTCPTSLSQVNSAFMNTQAIDTKFFPDDSNGRMTYWANCATGMGASLHELGHTFDLPHTPTGIMSRGFDNFNRLFMLREPGVVPALTRDKEAGAIWDPASVTILLTSEWIKK